MTSTAFKTCSQPGSKNSLGLGSPISLISHSEWGMKFFSYCLCGMGLRAQGSGAATTHPHLQRLARWFKARHLGQLLKYWLLHHSAPEQIGDVAETMSIRYIVCALSVPCGKVLAHDRRGCQNCCDILCSAVWFKLHNLFLKQIS